MSQLGIEPRTRRLRVRNAPVSLCCAELRAGRQSVAESGLVGSGSSPAFRPVRVSSAELSTASQPRAHSSEPRQERRVGALAVRQRDFRKQPRDPPVDHAIALPAGLLAQRTPEKRFAHTRRANYMMPIIFSASRSRIAGIRSMASHCPCVAASAIATASISSAVCQMTRSVCCPRGCLIRHIASLRSVLP